MSFKFTNANKWNDVWFSQLKLEEKVMFLYLCDMCDIAGFLEINVKLVTLQTGVEDVEGAIKALSKSIVYRRGYVWIKKYIKHQKNLPINTRNGAHKAIIKIIKEQINIFPEIFEQLPVVDVATIKSVLMGGGGGGASPPPTGKGIGISIGKDIGNTETAVTPLILPVQDESKIARLYKYFVGESNLMGQGMTNRIRRVLVEAVQAMDPEEWKPFCDIRLKDEYKASASKFFLEDGWRRYQDNVKAGEMEKKSKEVKEKESKARAEMPEQEAPEEFKEFVKTLGKRIVRDTKTTPDIA